MDEETIDRTLKRNIEQWPQLWRIMYNECIAQGFTEPNAMDLVKTYIMSIGSVTLKLG